jgi:hypothetical protein
MVGTASVRAKYRYFAEPFPQVRRPQAGMQHGPNTFENQLRLKGQLPNSDACFVCAVQPPTDKRTCTPVHKAVRRRSYH